MDREAQGAGSHCEVVDVECWEGDTNKVLTLVSPKGFVYL